MRRTFVPFALALLSGAPAFAQTNTWNGGTSTLWMTGLNWSGGTPVNGQIILFNSSAPNQSILLGGEQTAFLQRVQWAGGAQPAFTIHSGILRLQDGGLVRITSTVGAVTQTVSALTEFQGGGSINNDSAAATLSMGAVTIGPAATLSVGAVGPVNISGNIIGGSLVKVSPGTLTLGGMNNYSGTTQVQGGTLVASGSALASAPLELNGGVLGTSGSFSRTPGSGLSVPGGTSGFSAVGGALTVGLGGSVTWGSSSFSPSTLVLNSGVATHDLSFVTDLDLGGTMRTLRVDSGRVSFSGDATQGSLTKIGTGTLAFGGLIEIQDLQVAEGTVLINGSWAGPGNSTVHAAGTIGGTATLINGFTVRGTMAPGDGGPGVLSVGAAAFDSGSKLEIEIAGATPGSGHDMLRTSILFTSGTELVVIPIGGTYTTSDRVFFMELTSGFSGAFSFVGLPNNGAAGTRVPALDGFGGHAHWRIYYGADKPSGALTGGNDTALAPEIPCAADYNDDGLGDILDFLDFFDDFGTCENQPGPCGTTADADLNGDTIVDVLDFLDFFDAFGTGC